MRLVALAPGDRVSLATTALCRKERIALAWGALQVEPNGEDVHCAFRQGP